jgi:hypothetical protein
MYSYTSLFRFLDADPESVLIFIKSSFVTTCLKLRAILNSQNSRSTYVLLTSNPTVQGILYLFFKYHFKYYFKCIPFYRDPVGFRAPSIFSKRFPQEKLLKKTIFKLGCGF